MFKLLAKRRYFFGFILLGIFKHKVRKTTRFFALKFSNIKNKIVGGDMRLQTGKPKP